MKKTKVSKLDSKFLQSQKLDKLQQQKIQAGYDPWANEREVDGP